MFSLLFILSQGLAFCKDPDGYWVEIVKRGETANISNEMNFSQTSEYNI